MPITYLQRSWRAPAAVKFLQSASCFGMMLAVCGFGSPDAEALPVAAAIGTQTGNEKRYPIPASDSVNIDRDGQLILARYQGTSSSSRWPVHIRPMR